MLRHLKKKIRQHQAARRGLLTCALAAALLAVSPSAAWAADITNTATGSATVTISSISNSDANTIITNTATDTATATISGISNSSASTTIINTATGSATATISSGTGDAIDDNTGSTNTTITNIATGSATATISGYGTGIEICGTNTIIINTATGSATATIYGWDAINCETGASITAITNSGTITGDESGIYNEGTITAITNSGTISGTGSYGVGIGNLDGTIGTITNSGTISGYDAIYNESSGPITILTNSGAITGTGTTSDGIDNSGTISTITNQSGGSISGGTYGIYNDGTITILTNSGAITGTGTTSDGIDNSGTITVTNSGTITGTSNSGIENAGTATVTNSGTITGGSYGIYNTGGTATVTNTGTITGGSYGIYNTGGTATVTNTGNITGGSYGIYSTGGTITVTNSGSGTISGSTYVAYVTGGTVTITNENGGTLTGVTNVASGGTLDLTMNDSTWTVTGDSALTSLALNSGSLVKFVSGSYYSLSTATLSGSGGTICLYTNLAANSLDTLTITSSATGSYTLSITNTGSTTTNFYTAYKVIDLSSATTNTATFTTSGVDLGIWHYSLAQGSSLSSAYTDSTSGSTLIAGDYYIYNTFTPSAPVRAAISESASGKVMWYGEMNEIKKRLGDLRSGQQSSGDIWARTYGERYNVHTGSTSFSQSVHGGEIGKDNPQSFVGGKKFTGVLLGAGQADGTFSSGTGATKSVYAGAYGSWLYDNGVYCDLIGKYNWFTNSFATSSDTGNYRNTGVGLSVEAGKRFDKGNGKYIQPEAELSYLRAGSANYLTSAGLTVDDPTTSSLQLRLGVSAGKTWHMKDGTSRSYYGKLSIQNEFQGATTYVENYGFDSSLKGHQLIAGIGFTEDNKRHSIYIDLERSHGNAVSKPWAYNVGCRWKL